MPMTRETRSTIELILVLGGVVALLLGMLFVAQWLRYKDRGECLVQHRATVMEWYFNGVSYEDRPTSRMICDVWEYPEGR